MIHKLTDRVWFGDAHSPREAGDSVCAILNVAHVIRGRYKYDLNAIPHRVPYFRLACKDREDIDAEYARDIRDIAVFCEDVVSRTDKPMLTHCQFGGHRGPTAAIYMAWYFGGFKNLEALDARAWELTGQRPITTKGRGRYYVTMMELMRGHI